MAKDAIVYRNLGEDSIGTRNFDLEDIRLMSTERASAHA